MTSPAEMPSVDYAEDGVTLAFPIPFSYALASDIKAYRTVAGVETALAYGTAYSVAGGTLTLTASVAGATLSIRRETTRAQTADYTTTGAFTAESHEAALDRLARVDQEQDVEIGRAFRVPRGETPGMIEAAAVRGGRFAYWALSSAALTSLTPAAAAALLGPELAASQFKGDPGSPGEGYVNQTSLALAGLPALSFDDAYLAQEGRRGKFVFDASDLSAAVAADPQRGVFVPPTGENGSAGAWVRDLAQSPWLNPEWFGAQRQTAGMSGAEIDALRVPNRQAINAAIALAGFLGHSDVQLRRGTWPTDATVSLDQAGVTLRSAGAVISCNTVASTPVLALSATGCRITGSIETLLTGGSDVPWSLEINGANCRVAGVTMRKLPEAGGYHCYIRKEAEGLRMQEFATRGSNGIFVEASNSSFTGFDIVAHASGGDDCFAIKALNGDGITRNITISGGTIKGHAYGLSIGSEIGTNGVNDPTYSRGVFDITFSDVNLQDCTGFAFIKPGGVAVYDYRNGTVDGVTLANCTLRDLAGAKFQRALAITAARGARVLNVETINLVVTARAYTDGTLGPTTGALDCYNIDYTAVSAGISAPSVKSVRVRVRFNCPYQGQSNDVSRPGFPVQYVMRAENQTVTHGTMSGIEVDIEGDGASNCGALIGAGLDDAVNLRLLTLRNVSRNPASALSSGGVVANAKVKVGEVRIAPLANGSPFHPVAGAVRHETRRIDIPVGSFAAATGVVHDAALLVTNRACWIHSAHVIDAAGKVANAANYITIELVNQATGFPLASRDTSATALTQHTPVPLHTTAALASGDALNVPAATVVRLRITGTGTGMALDKAMLSLTIVEHGV